MTRTINCRGRLFSLSSPRVMGILNITPDSFYDGGKYSAMDAAVLHAGKLLEEGADFIDVGGYSSRPGAAEVSLQEELDRVVPTIQAITAEHPQAIISIDTFRSNVAREAVKAGASIVNDISAGLSDPEMLPLVAALQVPYIMMHMKGNPQNMQLQASYTDIIGEMLLYFSDRIFEARKLGVNDLILDPGFGFAKTIEQNFTVMKNLQAFEMAGLPILVGISRKSMIWKTLGTSKENSLNGTTALNMSALMKGAKILRVHDVKEAVECVNLFTALGY